MKIDLTLFENYKIRRHYDETTETWYFSVVDIIQALLQQLDFQAARKYWNKQRKVEKRRKSNGDKWSPVENDCGGRQIAFN